MNEITPEVLEQFVVKQGQIWQTIALHLSEQNNVLVEIPTPTTQAVPIGDLTLLTADPVLHGIASFTEASEEPCLFIVGEQLNERVGTQKALFEAIFGSTPENIDESHLPTVQEFFQQLMHGLSLAWGNLRNTAFTPGEVKVQYEPVTFPANFLMVNEVIATRFTVQIPDRTPFTLTWLLTEGLARHLLGIQGGMSDPLGELANDTQTQTPAPASMPATSFNPFQEVSEDHERNLDLLLDIPLEVSVELGRVSLMVRELLEIGTGSIIELKKTAGEPVEMLVNGRLVARGEVVVVEDNFAVRITEILSPAERVQKLAG